MMVGRGRLTASPRGKMHDGNGLRDQCADRNVLTDPSRRKNLKIFQSITAFSIKPKFFHEPISWKKCMMVGRGSLTVSPRGKIHDGNGLRDMVSRTHKCIYSDRRIAAIYSDIFTVKDIQ